MNHSALTDLLYGVSLPGSQFPHLYNEGPGFESGWPRLVGQTRAWWRAGPAGVLALLPPSPVTGGTALILGPCLSGRCEPYPRWHSPGSGKFPSPTCRSLSSSPSRLLGHPHPSSPWPLSATHLLQGSLLTPPPKSVPFPPHQLHHSRQKPPTCLLAGPPWGWARGVSGAEAEVPDTGLPEGPKELPPWASSLRPGPFQAAHWGAWSLPDHHPPNPRGARLEPARAKGSFSSTPPRALTEEQPSRTLKFFIREIFLKGF